MCVSTEKGLLDFVTGQSRAMPETQKNPDSYGIKTSADGGET